MLKIEIIQALEDNYIYGLLDEKTGEAAILDPGESQPAIDWITREGLELRYVINTHHHWDHTNGNKELVEKYGAKLAAPATEADKIKQQIDFPLEDGDSFAIGASIGTVLSVPGHTSGHIALHFPDSMAVFTGDTLFSLGCGRLFEGTAQQMWRALKRLRALPDNTQIYCGHEYTQNNAQFCLSLDPENPFLTKRAEGVERLRNNQRPTIPALMGMERKSNLFLRADDPDIAYILEMENAEPEAVFAKLRAMKDNF
tara:strand:+ start:374 stop:1141 length:768 start_codon:yes stop_codon:yes gene_type:complete